MQKCPNPLQQAQISSNNFFHLQRLEDNERLSANMINDRMRTYNRSSITTLYSLELLVQLLLALAPTLLTYRLSSPLPSPPLPQQPLSRALILASHIQPQASRFLPDELRSG